MSNKNVTAISFDLIQELITGIYDAALDEQRWNNTLNSLSTLFKAQQGNLRIVDSKSKNISRIYNFNNDSYWLKAYSDYFVHIDPWMDMIYENEDTLIECSHHLIPDKKYKAMEIHRDYITPQDIHYGIGGIININNDMKCYIAFQRGEKYDGFTSYQVNVLKALAPHIHKAILINEKTTQLEIKNNTLSNSLDQINSAILLVDNNGKILFINSLAEKLIKEQSGISIKRNCISLTSSNENSLLKKLIHEATLRSPLDTPRRGGAMSYSDPAGQTALSILISPINPDITNIDTQTSDIAMLVMSTNDHKTTLSTELITALYKLTPAEARLTLKLCHGLSLDEISELLCRSKNTLRTQLRSCFSKTGTSKQSELINLVNCGPANILKT